MIHVALPILSRMLESFYAQRSNVAKEANVPTEIVERVGVAFQKIAQKDERMLMQAQQEIEKARMHDVQTHVKDIWIVQCLRGLVRPVTTFAAFFWYIYARLNGVELVSEDYAIVGGIIAFWFGFRPFEKKIK